MKFLLMFFVVFPSLALAGWEEDLLAAINAERAYADDREFAIHGEVLAPRAPLTINPLLTTSAEMWVAALKGTGLQTHGWHTNDDGYLVAAYGETEPITRAWLPSRDRYSNFVIRNEFLGLFTFCSENGAYVKSTKVDHLVAGWISSGGWNIDPRLARLHYGNLVNPRWTEMGVAKGTWGSGKSSVFAEFIER